MKISKTMLRRHLERVTLGYLALGDKPPEDLGEFEDAVRELRLAATATGDLPWVKLGLSHLLSTPGLRLRDYGGGQYPYSDGELQDLLLYTWQQLWPGEAPSAPGEGAEIELVEMPSAEWQLMKAG